MTEAGRPADPLQGKSWTKFYEARDAQPVRPLLIRTLEMIEAEGRSAGRAIDLGCGQGIDTAELLARGWNVLAIDASEEGIDRTRRRAEDRGLSGVLETREAKFEDLETLPPVDLVYSAVSLPFCPPRHFDTLWQKIRAAVDAPRGWVTAQFFGPNDSWAGNPDLSFHGREEVEALFSGMEVRLFEERDEDGQSAAGPKHWHIFDVIAAPLP